MRYVRVLMILCIVMLAGMYPVRAQKFTGGLSAGIIASQVDGDTHNGYNKAGITAGGWVSISSRPNHAFRIGLNYIQKGSRQNPDPENGNYSQFLIRLGYAEMPFLYQYTMKNNFYIEGGASMGVMVHSYMYQTDGYSYEPAFADDPFRLMDFCGQWGLGYKFSDYLKMDLRMAYSLISISKGTVSGMNGTLYQGQFNNLLQFELSYTL